MSDIITKEESIDRVEIAPGKKIVMLRKNGRLTLAHIELAKDFSYIYKLCCLVESAPGTLPASGGWESQDDEFVNCWLIYKQVKNRKESAVLRELGNGQG